MKKLLFVALIICCFSTVQAQQFALFGTKTMFDAFENPSQKSFKLDTSRKFSSNFFLPNFGVNGVNRGSSEDAVRKLSQEGVTDTRNLPLGTGDINNFYGSANFYIATFRVFKSYKYQKEMGFAWQIRTDGNLDYTNETIAIFDSYTRFPQGTYLDGIFNTRGYQQSYHQFSFTYRENYNKRLAFGIKASLLSGILYNKIDIYGSHLFVDPDNNSLDIGINGLYASNFRDGNDIDKKTFIPTFKNPGLSVGFGTNYTTKKGLFLMANIKDLGFIWWRDNTSKTNIITTKTIDNLQRNQSNTNQEIQDIFTLSEESKKFLAATNAKIDVYMSKTFGFYKPGLVVSKNLFYKGGDVAFVNTFSYNNYSASLTPAYNLNDVFMFGVQAKYQNPNFELFLGSDNLLGTKDQINGIIKQDASIGSGNNALSYYMGIGIKFGNIVNHPQFSDTMPGVGGDENSGSFFRNLFSVFKKKNY